MGFIRNLKIRNKLLLLLVVVLIPLLFFSIRGLVKEMEEKKALQEVLEKLRESELLSGLLHEVQKERGLSLSYIASQGQVFSQGLEVQRQNTDLAINRLSRLQQLNPALASDLNVFNGLADFRQQVNRMALDSTRFESFHLNVREKLLERILYNAGTISDGAIRQQLIAYGYLVDAKVQMGLLRTLMSQVLIGHRFSMNSYAQFRSYKTFYDSHIKRFTQSASPAVLAAYQKQFSSGSFRELIPFLASIQRDPLIDLSVQNSEAWFTRFSRAIDQLREVEQFSIAETIGAMSKTIDQKNLLSFIYISTIVILMVVSVLISYYTVTTLSDSLQSLKTASDRVSRGYTDVEINIQSQDEIGELAESFRKLVQKNVQLAQVAEAVGEGRYDVSLEVQNEGDVLAHALNQMKRKLQDFSSDNANRQWRLNGLSELSGLMSRAMSMEEVSQGIVHFLTEYTSASVGVFYLLDEFERLNFAAGYALNATASDLPSYRLGEGVMGQAALNNQVLELHDVPARHLRIRTGTAEMEPVSVLIVPCYVEKELIGVLELAAQKAFAPRVVDLLRAASEKVAIVVHSLKVHIRTQELLYETQNQAEELETQQEELRQVNAELKAQKEQLQASEEELKVNQEELEEKNAELQEKTQQLEEQFEAIRAKNREVELAREAVELKMQQVETISRYKSDFLANMSHELRTPLNSILILSRLMADNTGNNLTPKQQEHAEIIYKSGSDLLKLINDILDLSKIESGQVNLEVREVNPRQMGLKGLFDQMARQKNIQFVQEIADDLPAILTTDQFRLEQVLKNLLSNAFKFTPNDGKVIYRVYPVHQKRPFSQPLLQQAEEVLAFSVQDTGIGIPKDKQQLIFEAFQQADTSTTRKYGGTGLGLSISRELAHLLGGEIQVESRENEGSTFTLFLPRHYQANGVRPALADSQVATATNGFPARPKLPEPAPATGSIQAALDKPNGSKKARSVLIIEDDKGFSQIVADFAEHKQFKVYQAFTGQQGLDLLYQQQPDAVLLDINLPDISGWDIMQRISEDPKLRNVKVHVMSAYDKEVLGRPMDEEEYIPKPVTLETLDKAFGKIRQEGKNIQTVLVVEDNEAENRAVSELLLAHNITSVSAFSGEQARTMLKKERVDCIILDLNLPDTGGFELMETIRESGQNLPIIIYSGKDLSEEEEFRLKKYANTIIIKNQFSYIRLLDEVQLFLHKINDKLPGEQEFKMKLHIPEEVLKDKKVLVVDDDVRNVYSLYNLLEQYQMKIVVANDGKEALEKVQKEKGIDIILMDMMMPEMDGMEATRRIRQIPAFARLPIIALTAKAMKGDKEKCIEAGASDYISKPLDVSKLLALMRVWLYKGI